MISSLVDLVKYFHHRGHRGAQGLLAPILTIHHALDSVPEMEDVEVDQQAHTHSAEAQVRQELSLMNWMDCLGGFYLHHYPVLHDQVDAVAYFDFLALVHHGQSHLRRDVKTSASEFVCEAGLVSTFEKAGAEKRVDSYRGADDTAGDFIDAKWTRPRCGAHIHCISHSPVFLCDLRGESVFEFQIGNCLTTGEHRESTTLSTTTPPVDLRGSASPIRAAILSSSHRAASEP